MNIVETYAISKQYRETIAVNEVTLAIPQGSIFGLIGQNGAGKSTLMKIICGQIHETNGSIRLFENDPKKDPLIYRRIGALIEQSGYYPSMSAMDNMKIKALALGCYDQEQLEGLLKICGIADTKKKKVKKFSLGMKQRLGIAMALLGNPELLVLDEPTNGLDPQGVREIRSLLLKLNQEQGITILISSHILEELSKIATDYAIIKEGCILEQLSKEELAQHCKDYIVLKTAQPEKAVALLEDVMQLKQYDVIENDVIRLYEYTQISKIIDVLVHHGIKIHEVYEHKQDLEDYFLKKSGDSLC